MAQQILLPLRHWSSGNIAGGDMKRTILYGTHLQN